ncbi:MAG: filamentous hemagglutinin N-terminal domain-containing protein [Candidatus Pacebacteria bacterium]|nr:filamentous hemagglutinin N-terminal domain-containing protein [Candidatus Paceibacterota bacterium]
MSRLFLNNVGNFSGVKLRPASLKGLKRGLLVSSAAMVLAAVVAQHSAQAAPVGGTVASGDFSTISTTGNLTTIVQTSDRGALNWDSFNVGLSETVSFTVPTRTSATLNRITGGGVSRIEGSINSNGIVYFSNPNGLIFDASSQVTANGFVATTADLTVARFMNSTQLPGIANLGAVGVNALTLNGSITANSIAAHAGAVTVGGSLDAGNANGVGGRIQVTANSLVTLSESAVISASGSNGGGNISIGGDVHGTGATPNAQFVTVKAGALIDADALLNGNGGTVAVWSDDRTRFAGYISAKGGANSGNGGFVETSGKEVLDFTGRVDTSAAHGKTGTLLLDPRNIEIKDNSGTTVGVTTTGATLTAATPVPADDAAGAAGWSILDVSTLVGLLRTANVTVDAASNGSGAGQSGGGNIKVTSAIDWSKLVDGTTANTTVTSLTLESSNSVSGGGVLGTIDINANISGSAGSSLILKGYNTITVAAGVAINMGATGTIDIQGITAPSSAGGASGTPNIVFNGTSSSAVTLTAQNVYVFAPKVTTSIPAAGGANTSTTAGSISVNHTTVTGNLVVGHRTSTAVGASAAISFVGTNSVSGVLSFGVSRQIKTITKTATGDETSFVDTALSNYISTDSWDRTGTEPIGRIRTELVIQGSASGFTLASGNSLSVGSIAVRQDTTTDFTYKIEGSFSLAGDLELTGSGGANIYSPTNATGVTGNITLYSFGGTEATNSLAVDNVTLAAGKKLAIMTASSSSGGTITKGAGGKLTLGTVTGSNNANGSNSNILNIDIYNSSGSSTNTIISQSSGKKITGIGRINLTYTGGNAILGNDNELPLVVLNSNDLTNQRGGLTLKSLTDLTIDYSYKDIDGTDPVSLSAANSGTINITTSSKTVGSTTTKANLTFANTATVPNALANSSLGIKGFADVSVTTEGNVVFANNALINPSGKFTITNAAGGTISLNAGAKIDAGDDVTLGKSDGSGGGITIVSTAAITAGTTSNHKLTVNGAFIDAQGAVKAGTLSGTITGFNPSILKASANFVSLSGVGNNPTAVNILSFTVTGTRADGFKVTAAANGLSFGDVDPVTQEVTDGLVVAESGGTLHNIDITSVGTVNVKGKVSGATVKLVVGELQSRTGKLWASSLDVENTVTGGALDLLAVETAHTTVNRLKVAGTLTLEYTGEVTFGGTKPLTVILTDTAHRDSAISTGITGGNIIIDGIGGLTIQGNSAENIVDVNGPNKLTGTNINLTTNSVVEFKTKQSTIVFQKLSGNEKGVSDPVSLTGTYGLALPEGSEFILKTFEQGAQFDWGRVSKITGGNLTLVVDKGSEDLTLDSTNKFSKLFRDATLANSMVNLSLAAGLKVRVKTTGTITVNGVDRDGGKTAEVSYRESFLGYSLEADTINLQGTNSFHNLDLKANSITQDAGGLLNIVNGDTEYKLTIVSKGAGNAVNLNLGAIPRENSAGAATASEFHLGAVDAKGAVNLNFKGNGTIAHSYITGPITSTETIKLNSVASGTVGATAAVAATENMIHFKTGERGAGHEIKLSAGGDITVSAGVPNSGATSYTGSIKVESRVISQGGRVFLKMGEYINNIVVEKPAGADPVADPAVVRRAGDGNVWDTTNQILVLPSTASYTGTVSDTGAKASPLTGNYNGAFFTGTEDTLVYSNLSQLTPGKLYVIRDDATGTVTQVDADAAAKGFAASDIKTMTASGLFGAGTAADPATITDLTGLIEAPATRVFVADNDVIFHNLGTVTGNRFTEDRPMNSLIIQGDLNTDGPLKITTRGGGVTATGVITTTGLSISAKGAVSLTGLNKITQIDRLQSMGTITLKNDQNLALNNSLDTSTGGDESNYTVALTVTNGNLTMADNRVVDGYLELSLAGNYIATGKSLTSNGILLKSNLNAVTAAGATDNLTLVSGVGGISQAGGTIITANQLSLSAKGVINLTGANQIDQINKLESVGDISFTNAKALILNSDIDSDKTVDVTDSAYNVNLTVTAGGLSHGAARTVDGVLNLDITGTYGASGSKLTAGSIVLKRSLNAGTTDVSLETTVGGISQEVGTVLTARNLSLKSKTSIDLSKANMVDAITKLDSVGDISFTNAKALTLNGNIDSDTTAGVIYSANSVNLTVTTGGLSLLGADRTVNGTLNLNIGGSYSSGGFKIVAGTIVLKSNLDAGSANLGLISTKGGITQESGMITANELSLNSAGIITLTGANRINQIKELKSIGEIRLVNDKNLTLGADIDSDTTKTGSTNSVGIRITTGDFTLGNSFVIDGNLNLSVAGNYSAGSGASAFQLTANSISLKSNLNAGTNDVKLKTTVGGITQDSGAIITANRLWLDSAGVITLGQDNKVTSVEQLKSAGVITFTNNQSLTLNSTIDSGTNNDAIAITVKTGDLTVSVANMSSNGNLSLTVTGGKFTGGTNAWNLNNKTLTAIVNDYAALVDDVIFTNLSTDPEALTTSLGGAIGIDRAFGARKNYFFTSKYRFTGGDNKLFTAYEAELQNRFGDSNIELHHINDLNVTGKSLKKLDATPTSVRVVSVASLSDDDKNISIIEASGRIKARLKVEKVNFYGVNRLADLNLSGGLSDHSVSVVINSDSRLTLTGTLSFGSNSGEIIMAGGDGFQASRVSASTTVKVTNNDSSWFSLSATKFDISAGGLVISSMGGTVNLGNSGNAIVGDITATTRGGSVYLSGGDLTIKAMKTGGGSVTLGSTGSIVATGLETGSIGYRALGGVSLSGKFAGASGSAQSVSLNSSSAGVVVGDTNAAGAVDFSGNSGTTILAGNVSSNGGGTITFGNRTDVAKDAAVTTNSGYVRFGGAVDSSNSSGLIINAGDRGSVELNGDVGKKQALKWIEIDANLLNAINVTVRTMGAKVATTSVGTVGIPRIGDIMMNLTNFNNGVSFDSTNGGLNAIPGAKTRRLVGGGFSSF